MLRPRLFLAACALLAATVVTRSGRADDNEATARALFEQATRDMDAGVYDKACPELVEVVRLARGIGSMIKLGKCYEAQGKLASAWASFKEAAEAAHLAVDGREAAADAKAQELLTKLSRLTINVSAGAAGVAGLTIKRDDAAIIKAQWNTDLPVDSGKHVVTASAPGKKTWTGTVDVPTAAGTTPLDVPPLEDEAPVAVAPVRLPGAPVLVPAQPPPEPLPPKAGSKTWAWAIGAGGLVALGVGAAFGVGTAIEEGNFHTSCPGVMCPAGTNQAQVNGYVSARDTDKVLLGVFGGVGVVGLGIGSYGLLRGKSGSDQARLIVLPGGARLEGVFW